MLEGDVTYELEKIAKQPRNDVQAGDETSARSRKDLLVRKIEALPTVVWNAMLALMVIPEVEARDPVKADRMRQLRSQLIAALREGRKEDSLARNNELVVYLNEADQAGSQARQTPTDLVAEFKKPFVSPTTYRR